MSNGYIPLQHRGLPDNPEDGEHIVSDSIRPDRRRTRESDAIVGHHTRESFIQAVSRRHARFDRAMDEPAPIQPGYSAAEALAGLRRAYGVTRTGGER